MVTIPSPSPSTSGNRRHDNHTRAPAHHLPDPNGSRQLEPTNDPPPLQPNPWTQATDQAKGRQNPTTPLNKRLKRNKRLLPLLLKPPQATTMQTDQFSRQAHSEKTSSISEELVIVDGVLLLQQWHSQTARTAHILTTDLQAWRLLLAQRQQHGYKPTKKNGNPSGHRIPPPNPDQSLPLPTNGLRRSSTNHPSGWITTLPLALLGPSASTSWSSSPKTPTPGHSQPDNQHILASIHNHWFYCSRRTISLQYTGKQQKNTTT